MALYIKHNGEPNFRIDDIAQTEGTSRLTKIGRILYKNESGALQEIESLHYKQDAELLTVNLND